MVEDKGAKGKPFDDSLNSVIKSFTPACVPLAKISHMAKVEDNDNGKYTASTGKDTASHTHWVGLLLGAAENNREQNENL